MSYYVYILSSKRNGTFYIGMTNNLARRIQEHKEDIVEGFTKYDVHNLVYYEAYDAAEETIRHEKNVKAWKRAWNSDN